MRRSDGHLRSAAIGLSFTLGTLLTLGSLLTPGTAHAQQAVTAGAVSSAAPLMEPPYDPSAHGGLPEGAWLRISRGTGRRSTGMMVTGIVITGVGAGFMAVATAIYATKGSCTDVVHPTAEGSDFESGCSSVGHHEGGLAMLIAATIGVAVGLPLWILGGSDVPWVEAASLHAPPSSHLPRPAWAAAAPSLTSAQAGHGAGLLWHF